MTLTSGNGDIEERGSRLLRFVEAITITPEDAKHMAEQYLDQSRKKYPQDSTWQHQLRASDAIIKRHAKLAAIVGATTALPGIIPGWGTAVVIGGGALTDVGLCLKLQADMCFCLAAVFEYNITSEDARHLSYLLAATGTVQHAGTEVTVQVGSRAGVRMLRHYLKGPALKTVTQVFSKVGVRFTRKGLEKALPLGIGVSLGIGANYSLTRFVGKQAKEWFVIDSSELEEPPGEPESEPT